MSVEQIGLRADQGVAVSAEAHAEPLLEVLLDAPADAAAVHTPTGLSGARIGVVAGVSETGQLLVDYTGNSVGEPVPARSTVRAGSNDVGRDVVLMFEGEDPQRPIVMGLLDAPPVAGKAAPQAVSVPAAEVDGERVVFTAEKEIVLRCGQASITLTRAGKVLIRGAYLLSRSSGVNRIKGGSVQIN